MTRDKVSILLMSNRIPNMMVVSDTANNIDMILLMCVVLMPFRFAVAYSMPFIQFGCCAFFLYIKINADTIVVLLLTSSHTTISTPR